MVLLNLTEMGVLLYSWADMLKDAAPIFGGSVVLGILIVLLANKMTGGRGVLYKFIQDYGYDDARTHEALEDCIIKILIDEGFGKGNHLSFFHEVGNTFTGTFLCDGIQHEFVLRTDGWHFEYQIDNGIPKKWKP